jgi:DHA1 family bicyclomycin/chloramphenicol resistance-like MFS transporter
VKVVIRRLNIPITQSAKFGRIGDFICEQEGMELLKTAVKSHPSFAEFVVLVSTLMALTALSIDAMLPALAQIGTDLQVQDANSRQLVISMIFLGLSVGQLFFGPLSDSVGRKPAVFSGLGVYMGGAILSMFAVNFPMMLAGRFLQGIGASAPRAVTLALVRDQFAGRQMARVMSFVMTVFILVPMLAPSLGQIILQGAGWRAIFGVFLLLAVIALVWFAIRQPETLAPENRAPFTPGRIFKTTKLIVQNRLAFGYTITAGLVSGAFIGYLNSAQQVFQEQYALGDLFSIYFGIVASAIGLASLLNSRLVLHFGMRVSGEKRLAYHQHLVGDRFGEHAAAAGAAALCGVYGLLDVVFLLCGHPVWQSEFPGDGTAGADGWDWGGYCRLPLDVYLGAAGNVYWSELQRDDCAAGDRSGGALRAVAAGGWLG